MLSGKIKQDKCCSPFKIIKYLAYWPLKKANKRNETVYDLLCECQNN